MKLGVIQAELEDHAVDLAVDIPRSVSEEFHTLRDRAKLGILSEPRVLYCVSAS